MAGFIMISAYTDSSFAKPTVLSRSDAVVFLTYMQMMCAARPRHPARAVGRFI